MLLIGKDKKKSAVHKGKGSKQIKFEPVFVFGAHEGFGKTEIKLWKQFNNNKVPELKNGHKRKHRKNLNVVKRGKSQSITPPQKKTIKGRLTTNGQPNAIKETILNQKEVINYFSPDNKINKSIKDLLEEEKILFIPCFFSDYSNENEEYKTKAQLVLGSDSLKYPIDQQMGSKPISENLFSHNLTEYPNNIEGESSVFESHYSYNYLNQHKEYTNTQLNADINVSNIRVNSDLNNKSNREKLLPNALIELMNEDGENKLFTPNTSSDHKEYPSDQIITESQALKHISKVLTDLDFHYKSNSDKFLPNTVFEFTSKNGENKLFISNSSSDYEEYDSNQFITECETLKNNTNTMMELKINNKSNSGEFLPNAVNEFVNDYGENILFVPDTLSAYKEYTSNQLLTESQTLKNIPEALIKSYGVTEFPSNNQVYLSTPEFTSPHSLSLISLEESANKSVDFYQNMRKGWSLESSKVLLTSSKESLESDGPLTSKGCEIIKLDQNPTTTETTQKDFRKLLDALDANLNSIINDCQLQEQSISKLQDEKNNNLNEYQVQDQEIVKLQNSVNHNSNDHRNSNQTMKMVENNNINDAYVNFTVLKKLRGDNEITLDGPEDIETSIFTRNKISPGFKNLISDSHIKIFSKEQKLTQERESDNVFTSKIYSFDDILHNKISKNNDSINFEAGVQKAKVSQESKKQIFKNENLNYINNFTEDETSEYLFNNGNIQASEGIIQQDSNNETSQENCYNDEKPVGFSFLSINSCQKDSNAFLESTKSLVTTMSKRETPYFEEMMMHGLEETSIRTTIIDTEKNIAINNNVHNSFFEPGETNHPRSSTYGINYFQTRPKEPHDEILYQLVSKSNNNNIKNSDRDYDERMAKNYKEDTSNTKFSESQKLILQELQHLHDDELPFPSIPQSKSIQELNFNNLIDDIINKLEKEGSEKENLTLLNGNLENSRTKLETIATVSYILKEENEIPENFRLISEEKEKSSIIMNMGINKKQSCTSLQDSIVSGCLPDEKSIPPRDKNIQNTNLYFMKHRVKSPYHNSHYKQNMIVNIDNIRRKSIQDKLFNCFRKLNFWAKRKSAGSHVTNNSSFYLK